MPLAGVAPAADPVLHGRLHALGPGKDSTAGHWELMGVIAPSRCRPTREGFPEEVHRPGARRQRARACSATAPSNGIEAIERYGDEHLAGGDLIVYTSQDSVLQIAAHVDVARARAAARDLRRDPCARCPPSTRSAG